MISKVKKIQPFKKELWPAFHNRRISLLFCWIAIIVIIWSNFSYKFWNDKGRIIVHDVISYYQYLPAVFIYHDISLKFIEGKAAYFSDKVWAVRMENGRYLGRMTMGLAVMYAPFFLVSHAIATPLGYESDGYSPPYKFALVASAVFYLGLGLFFLRKVLKKYFPDMVVALTLLLIALATNVYFYSIIEPAMSHVYSFCLFAAFLYFLQKWLERKSLKDTLLLGFIIGMIALVRPNNIIILILIPLWEVASWKAMKERSDFLMSSWKKVLVMAAMTFLVILPQLIYWKYVTGHFLYYTYNDEGFFFNNPQFLHGLFSYRKGWLIYTPVMIFSILGFITLYLKFRRLFFPVLIFTLINLYIVFSWWNWWYGGSFGQRSLIESYALLSIPLASLNAWIIKRKWMTQAVFFLIAGFFIFLNIYQTHQYYIGSINWAGMTKEAYWDSFLRQKPSERFKSLLRFPDVGKAKQGIYADLSTEPEKIVIDTSGRAEYIRNMENFIRQDEKWYEEIRVKAQRWGKPVDTVLRNDAIWLWEKDKLKKNN